MTTMLKSILNPSYWISSSAPPADSSLVGLRTQILENYHYLHPEQQISKVMLITSSYQSRYAAHIVQRPKEGGKRLLSSKFCMSRNKAMENLLEVTEENVYRRLHGYGDLRVQEVRK
ncbi:hypothetical protein KCU99_g8783, partial [Aureobasidium melanogenum]